MALIGILFLALFGLIGFAFFVAGIVSAALWLWNDFAEFVAGQLAQEAASHDTYAHGDIPALHDLKAFHSAPVTDERR